METRAHYIIVGALVLVSIAIAFGFILWIGSTQREFDEYRIVFTEQVSGLNQGGAVRFNGIQVGEVRTLEINEEGLVEALVRIDKKTPVKTDTVARLEIVGFTGLAIIQFEGGSPGAPLLKDEVNGIPVLRAQQSGIGLLITGSEAIVKSINQVLSPENVKAIGGIFHNVEDITGTLADSGDDIALTFANAAQLSGDLARASDELDRLLKNLDSLATEDAVATLHDIRKVLNTVDSLAVNLNDVVGENRANLKAFTENGLAQIGPSVTELRRLLRTADNFLRQLERDPAGYLLGEPVPEYKAGKKE